MIDIADGLCALPFLIKDSLRDAAVNGDVSKLPYLSRITCVWDICIYIYIYLFIYLNILECYECDTKRHPLCQ